MVSRLMRAWQTLINCASKKPDKGYNKPENFQLLQMAGVSYATPFLFPIENLPDSTEDPIQN